MGVNLFQYKTVINDSDVSDASFQYLLRFIPISPTLHSDISFASFQYLL